MLNFIVEYDLLMILIIEEISCLCLKAVRIEFVGIYFVVLGKLTNCYFMTDG